MSAPQAEADRAPFGWGRREFLIALAVLTALRVLVLVFTPINLHGDEAQYWSWSRRFDWGYFSKPPLIAWTIAATTGLFGDREWAVRLAAPFAHAGASALLYALANRMYGRAAAFWAGAGWALTPGIMLSAALISTDALVLPLWSAALYCAWRLIETRSWRWALGLGAALGLGLLAKYAMAYFFLGAALACFWSKPARQALMSPNGALAALIAAAFLAPNLIWNATHSFATISHTAANANLKHFHVYPGGALTFIVDQLGVFGPLQAGALVFLMIDAARRWAQIGDKDRFLLALAAPPLAAILAEAVLSRAHANWAAAAYPSAIVWIAGRLCPQPSGKKVLGASLALHAIAGAVAMMASLSPMLADHIGLGNALKRARGWPETASLIATRAAAGAPDGKPYSAIMVDNRLVFFSLGYYWRDHPPATPLRIWLEGFKPANQAEAIAALTAPESGRVLVVFSNPKPMRIIPHDFTALAPIGHAEIDLGGGKKRVLDFAVASGLQPSPIRGEAATRAYMPEALKPKK